MTNATEETIGAIQSIVQGTEPRLLFDADLHPVQGQRFQPTGFPDLGAATFSLADGMDMLLVESAQSIANRLESVCWDEGRADLVPALGGLPYVRVLQDGRYLTSSLQEFHRLNSPYILEAGDRFFLRAFVGELYPRTPASVLKTEPKALTDALKKYFDGVVPGPVDVRGLARGVFKYDPNSVIHGVFLARDYLAGGRLRLQRILSGFIEARGVRPAESGGVKFDTVDPSGDTRRGFGHVPFHRTEYTAERITGYFNLDLATLRGYGLGVAAESLIVGLSLWKIAGFLGAGLRLRTACDLECRALRCTRPEHFRWSANGPADRSTWLTMGRDLEEALPSLISACHRLFADPPVTQLTWEGTSKAPKPATGSRSSRTDVDVEEDGDR